MTALCRKQDLHAPSEFLDDVLEGLAAPQKVLKPKYFYDEAGSKLFEAITRLPEYYLTRTETALIAGSALAIARFVGEGAILVEYGAGSGEKAALLLPQLSAPCAYLCVEISEAAAQDTLKRVKAAAPALPVTVTQGDFTKLAPGSPPLPAGRRVGFFPGSTIGNFDPREAADLLRAMRMHLGPGARFVLGADRAKSPEILKAAYDDADGVTAAFNLNLLTRINRELGGNFDLGGFRHRAVWNPAASRIEMHLEALRRQEVSIAGRVFRFEAGETIHTENSYKFTAEALAHLCAQSGWTIVETWNAPGEAFSLLGLGSA